jgi:hypothetical protein
MIIMPETWTERQPMIARADWLHVVEDGLLGSDTDIATGATRGEAVLAAVRDLGALLPVGARVSLGGRSVRAGEVLDGLRRLGRILSGLPVSE